MTEAKNFTEAVSSVASYVATVLHYVGLLGSWQDFFQNSAKFAYIKYIHNTGFVVRHITEVKSCVMDAYYNNHNRQLLILAIR